MIFSNGSQVFGSADVKLEATLKNPNQFREAIIFEAINNLPTSKVKEFIGSEEAKVMLSEGMITQDMLERLAAEHDSGVLKTTVCHMAKEEDDPIWDEFVQCRMQERRLMNELLEKYGEKAKDVVDNVNKTVIEACIPAYFRQ